jgi:hypothetical protein
MGWGTDSRGVGRGEVGRIEMYWTIDGVVIEQVSARGLKASRRAAFSAFASMNCNGTWYCYPWDGFMQATRKAAYKATLETGWSN